MVLCKLGVLALLLTTLNYAFSLPGDVEHLREHFIANLLEENRGSMKMMVTDEIQHLINQKIGAFMNVLNGEEATRKRRDTNDLLLNDKPTDATILKGFERRGIVPVNFPRDICMFRIHGKSFAAGLSYGRASSEKETPVNATLTIFKRDKGAFHKIHVYKSSFLTKIDCNAANDVGYVAVVNSITVDLSPDDLLKSASFVYRVKYNPASDETKIEKLQTFAEAKQIAVRLWPRDNSLYLVYTYTTDHSTPLEKCTVFKLAGSNFNPIDTIPCQNARVIEFFTVNHDLMILVGNYKENNGTTNAFSSIMRYDLPKQRFVEHQKIYTNAITVGKYFFLEHQHKRHYFLFIGNSFEINEFGEINNDVLSLIYKYVDGFFIPLQTINAMHVQEVAPVMGKNNEFHLLITSEDRDVQIYFYDGWKFQESTLDFTGSTFSSGVSSMRAYDKIIDGTTLIVISNVNAFGNQSNVFIPVYSVHTDSSNLKTGIIKWCTNAFSQLQAFDIDEAFELVNATINMTDTSNPFAKFNGNVLIKNSTIKTVNAEQFMKKDFSVFNKTSVERINDMGERYKRLQKDVQRLKNKIDFTTSTSRIRRQTSNGGEAAEEPLIDTLIVQNSITMQTLNGKSISDIVYKSNKRNKRLRSIVAKEVLVKKSLFVDGKVDGIEISESNLILNVPHQVLNPVAIESINVKNFQAKNVNDQSFNEFFKLLRRKVDKKMPNMIHQLDIDALHVEGLINNRSFKDLAIDSLKTTGNQEMIGAVNIENLHADGIMFKKDSRREAISKVPISHLLNVKDRQAPLQISQDVQFAESVDINKLFIRQRLSNVNVRDGVLQVLRKKGGPAPEQVVTAEKSFSSINLLQPIVLRGKIESKTLEKMNPIVTIDDNLLLEGDYVIRGPVTIRRHINATENIFTNGGKELSLRKLVDSGLNLHSSNSTNLRLNFQSVVEAQNVNAKTVNGREVESFVKVNYPGEQVVRGQKTFKKGLHIVGGIVEAGTINDINLERLNETVLKRNAPYTQFVDGNIEFADLSVERLVSPSITIKDKNIKDLLSTSKSQNLKHLKANFIRAHELNAHAVDQTIGAKVLGKDLNFLIDDAVRASTTAFDKNFMAKKNFNDLSVRHLEFSKDNEWKSIIANFNNRIVEEFNVSGSYAFERQMSIGSLQIHGKINGVSQEDMTKNWLQVEGAQTFTEPQTFRFARVDGNMGLSSGLINDNELARLYDEAIWIDGDEMRIDSLEIDGILGVAESVKADSVNGLQFTDDIIRNNTREVQRLGKIKIKRDAHIQELSFEAINGIIVQEFLQAFRENEGFASVYVNGVATFDRANVKTLNEVDLSTLFYKAWLSYRNVTLTGNAIDFAGESVVKGILYVDMINNRDFEYCGLNYFSKSSSGEINAHLNVLGDVEAKKSFYAGKVIVPKSIHITPYLHLNLTDFANNILRHSTLQHVRGNWTIRRLFLHGNFDGLLNGMDMSTDVLHTSNIRKVEVTGHKRFGFLKARDIIASYVNGVELFDWFENHVRINSQAQQLVENQVTFKGIVRFDNNLQVRGPINGIVIKSDTILTKSSDYQVINGDVTIESLDIDSNQMRQVFIKHLKLRDSINDKSWSEFYENAFKKGDTFISSSERLVFENELQMDSAWTNKSIYGTDIGEFLKGSSVNNDMIRFKSNMEELTEVCDDLMRSLDDTVVELSHFEHHQSIKGVNIESALLFSIENGDSYEYALAVHEISLKMEMISFYHWNREQQMFVVDPKLKSLQYGGDIYRITQFHKIVYAGSDRLYVELFDNQRRKFYQYLMRYDPQSTTFVPFIQTTDETSMKIFTWNNGSDPCYGAIYQAFENIKIHCLNKAPFAIKTRPIRKISSHEDILIMLTDEDLVKVWYKSQIFNLPMTINPKSFASIRYKDKIYLAVQSDRAEGTVHHGYINIFVSSVHEMKFQHLQRLSLNIPIVVKFSQAPSGDMLLYVLTRNPIKALSVYTFAGSSNFVEIIGDSTIVSEASDLDVIQIDNNAEVVSVVSGDIVYIIQAALIEY